MSDNLDATRRSWNMSRISGKDTKPEILVRKYLFGKGYRFRKNDKRYPGKPDIVLKKYHTMIFVHGCFWHHHEGCKEASIPKTRTDFWTAKFQKNKENDEKNQKELQDAGWNVIVIWECEIEKDFENTMSNLEKRLEAYLKCISEYNITDKNEC